MIVNKFTSKPVTIEAVYLDNSVTPSEVASWCSGKACGEGDLSAKQWIEIGTLEGTMRANFGDWIIKGTRGEFYPCKADVFETKYAPVRQSLDDTLGGRGIECPTCRRKLLRPINDKSPNNTCCKDFMYGKGNWEPGNDSNEVVKLEDIKGRETLRLKLVGRLTRIWSGEHFAYWGPNNSGYFDKGGAGVYGSNAAYLSTRHCGPEKKIEFHLINSPAVCL